MWQYLFESGTWSASGLIVGYLTGKNLAEIRHSQMLIRKRLDQIEERQERTEEKDE